MRIDPEDFRRHYASLSDEALIAVDRDELVEVAQRCYDEELARRDLTDPLEEAAAPPDQPAGVEDAADEFDIHDGPPPDWLPDAACVCAFAMHSGTAYPPDVAKSHAALRAAGIPCHVTMDQRDDPPAADPPPQYEYRLMVPGALNLHATSVLDREIFNPEQEASWRTHFEELSDEDLSALNPEVFCAGLLDRAARLKRAYRDEIARRQR